MANKLALYISTTRLCNLGCAHCFQSQHGAEKLAPKFVDETIKFVEDNPNINQVVLLGGESFIDEKNLFKYLNHFSVIKSVRPNFSVSFITNGTIYLEWLKDFKDIISGLQFSIDGGSIYHDGIRFFKGSGEPSYRIVMDNLKKYREDGFRMSVHGVYNPKIMTLFIDSLEEFFADIPKDVLVGFEIVRVKEKENVFREWKAIHKIYKVLDKYHALGYSVHKARGAYEGNAHHAITCKSGTTLLGLDATNGHLYDCHETIGDESTCVGNFDGVDADRIKSLVEQQDFRKYYFARIPKFISKILMHFLNVNICWRENINANGDWRIVPIRLLILNMYGNYYNKRWKKCRT